MHMINKNSNIAFLYYLVGDLKNKYPSELFWLHFHWSLLAEKEFYSFLLTDFSRLHPQNEFTKLCSPTAWDLVVTIPLFREIQNTWSGDMYCTTYFCVVYSNLMVLCCSLHAKTFYGLSLNYCRTWTMEQNASQVYGWSRGYFRYSLILVGYFLFQSSLTRAFWYCSLRKNLSWIIRCTHE